jgi:CHAD domain-containing protein
VRAADMRVTMVEALLAKRPHTALKDRTTLNALLVRMADSERRAWAQRIPEPAWQQRLLRITAAIASDGLLLKPRRDGGEECRLMLAASIKESRRALRKNKSDIAGLHKLRIRIKSTRYVCEILSPLAAGDTQRLQCCLQKLQDILGDIHDLYALSKWIRTASIPTPLAKPLVKQCGKRQAKLYKKYRRTQSAVCNCLRRTETALRSDLN